MGLNREELSEKIGDLIKSGKEGETWDFKAKWYVKAEKSELVKDIICMANNPTPSDAYIIIGVDENTKKPLDDYCLENDPSRKSEEDLITILSSDGVKFANNNIPEVRLETVQPLGCGFEVDVIIIKSTNRVPYYLTNVYTTGQKGNGKKIESDTIYVRRASRNSKVGSATADFPEIEALWKKRFGLTLSIKERFDLLLSNEDDWEFFDVGDSDKDYFDRLKSRSRDYILISKSCPDFTIRISNRGDLPYFPDPVGWFYSCLIEWLPPYILGIDVFSADKLSSFVGTRRVCDVAGCGYLNLFFKEFKLHSLHFDMPGVKHCYDLDTLFMSPGLKIATVNMMFLRPKFEFVYAYFYIFKEGLRYKLNSLLRSITKHKLSIFSSEKIDNELNDIEEWLFKRFVVCFENIKEKDEFDKYLNEYFIKKFEPKDSFIRDMPRAYVDMQTTYPYEMKFSYGNSTYQLNKDSLIKALELFMENNKSVIDSQMVSNFIESDKNNYINDFMLNIFIVKHFKEWKKTRARAI